MRSGPMSALGQEQTCAVQNVMSALPLKAETIAHQSRVRNPKALAATRCVGERFGFDRNYVAFQALLNS